MSSDPKKKRDTRDARVLQDATGAKYMVCLDEVRRRKELLKEKVITPYDQAAWWARVDALPDPAEGEVRCVRCLGPIHGKPTKCTAEEKTHEQRVRS